jgi:flagellar assembly protein FliH
MPKVSRAGEPKSAIQFNLSDVAAQAVDCLARARAEAANILAEAAHAASAIRESAEAEGRRAAAGAVDRMVEQRVAEQLASLKPVLAKSYDELRCAREEWLSDWETRAVRLGTSIAERIIRRELCAQHDIPLTLVREALELAAGCRRMRLLMNPADVHRLAEPVQKLLDEFASVAATELVADASISAGGCRVETEHGSIDQQIEAQLSRIAEELS